MLRASGVLADAGFPAEKISELPPHNALLLWQRKVLLLLTLAITLTVYVFVSLGVSCEAESFRNSQKSLG